MVDGWTFEVQRRSWEGRLEEWSSLIFYDWRGRKLSMKGDPRRNWRLKPAKSLKASGTNHHFLTRILEGINCMPLPTARREHEGERQFRVRGELENPGITRFQGRSWCEVRERLSSTRTEMSLQK